MNKKINIKTKSNIKENENGWEPGIFSTGKWFLSTTFFLLSHVHGESWNFSEITCQRVHFSDYKLALPMNLNWRFWLVI